MNDSTRLTAFALIVLLGLTALVYWPGLSGDFLFDDFANLLENRAFGVDRDTPGALADIIWSSPSSQIGRPLAMWSFGLNWLAAGLDPWGFKLTNLALHLTTGLLLFFLARLLIDAWRLHRPEPIAASTARRLALIVTAAWLLHPLQLTTVLYVVQRMAGLAALLSVAGLCIAVSGRLRMARREPGGTLRLWTGALLFGGLALFSKETGILMPAWLLAIELAFFHGRDLHGTPDRRIHLFFALTLGLPALVTLGWLLAHPDFFARDYAGRDFDLAERLMTQARALWFYVQMIFLPRVSALGLHHDDIAISRGLLDPATTLPAALGIVAILGAAFVLRRRAPLFAFAVFWFLAGHALESTMLALELVHEHRNYLPSFGPLFAATIAIAPLKRDDWLARTRVAALFLFITAYGAITWTRAVQWGDNIVLALHEAANHPDSPRARHAAGRMLAKLVIAGHSTDVAGAYAHLETAARLDARNALPDLSLIHVAARLDQPPKAEWTDSAERKLRLTPPQPDEMNELIALADCRFLVTPCTVASATMERLFAAATANPRLENRTRAILLSHHARFRARDGATPDRLLPLIEEATRLDPHDPLPQENLVTVLTNAGQSERARSELARLDCLDPDNVHSASRQNLRQRLGVSMTAPLAPCPEPPP